MPPTATEVNARLHKAVNEEGNVLNIEAVNDMISWLEKINITMEVLEETRIGLRMNLMRKNLQDKELAKRVKNLLKKWKKDMEKLKEKNNGITNANEHINNRFNSQPGNIQNLKRNVDNHKQAGLKRKRMSAENLPLQRTSSPRVSSPSLSTQRIRQSSPSTNSSSPSTNSSSPKQVTVPRSLSSKVPRNVSGSKDKEMVTEKHVSNTSSPLINNAFHINSKIDENKKNLNVSNDLKSEIHVSNDKNGIHNDCTKNETEDELNNSCKQDKFDIVKDTDTRTQENRISSLDSGYHGTLSCDENSPSLSPDDKIFLPIEKATSDLNEEVNTIVPEHFEPIEPEDLELQRKEVPDNPVCPNTEADGVNGIYDENDQFCGWTEEITYKEKDYHVLPYVILD